MLDAILKTCHNNTEVCIACDLTTAEETVVSKTVGEWKKMKYDFDKRPAVFLIYSRLK